MKKIILAIAFLFSLSLHGQVTYLHVGDRLPNLYYWDTNWWDYYHLYRPVLTQDNGQEHQDFEYSRLRDDRSRRESARYFYTDSTLTIIGVAAAIEADTVRYDEIHHRWINRNYTWKYADTSIANREPEYFCLYKPDGDTMILLAKAEWDTKEPVKYMICVGKEYDCKWDYTANAQVYFYVEYFAPLRETYFASPITVTDSFYLSYTRNNNYRVFHDGKVKMAHPGTIIYGTHQPGVGYNSTTHYGPRPGNARYRFHLIDEYNYPIDENDTPADTNWHTYFSPVGSGFINVFPIFDTSRATTWITDSCTAPTYVALNDASWEDTLISWGLGENMHWAVIEWNFGSNSLWEMAVKRLGDSWDNAETTQCTANFATLTGLDTAQWYAVRVRAVCDSDRYSPWSDSIKFYVPANTAMHGTERIETVVDRYTHLIPNPAHGQVRVLSSFFLNSVEIYTLNGRLVERRSADGITLDLDLSGYTPGIYLVRIVTPKGTALKKLVVQ